MVLFAVNAGLMDDVPLDRCGAFEEQLLRYVATTHPDLCEAVVEARDVTEEIEPRLTQAITDFKGSFS